MGFKMKGSTFYGKPTGNGAFTDGSTTVNRKMDKSSKPDGRAKSSAFQKNGDGKTAAEINEEKRAKVLEKAADRDKQGGIGATNYKEAEDVNLAKHQDRVADIHKMSKKEALEASGKKTHLLNRLTKSKRKLKSKLRGESTKIYYDRKGKGLDQQTLKKGEVKNVDKYSGVS